MIIVAIKTLKTNSNKKQQQNQLAIQLRLSLTSVLLARACDCVEGEVGTDVAGTDDSHVHVVMFHLGSHSVAERLQSVL